MKKTVFWSWQSDLPEDLTRTFIKRAIVRAIDRVSEDLELQLPDRLEIDHDTKGEAGLVEIVSTIFRKIDECQIFVADVTPIVALPGDGNKKKIPNPNVMIELGYAMRELGPQRIITVANTAFGGKPEDLPFDLRHRRGAITYELQDAKSKDADKVNKRLADSLAQAIAENLKSERADQVVRNPSPKLSIVPINGSSKIAIDRSNVDQVVAPSLDDVIKNNPKRSPAEKDRPLTLAEQIGRLSIDPILGQRRTKNFRDWTIEEIDGYNESLDRYYLRYDKYLGDLRAHGLLMTRSAEIHLAISNSGFQTATGVWASIEFPAGTTIYELKDKPKPPSPPLVPAFAPHGRSTLQPYSVERGFGFSERPRIGENGRSIAVRVEKLQHEFYWEIPVFVVVINEEADVGPFEVEYRVGCNEMPISFRGKINFDVDIVA
ncbi:hypothetical protein GUR46_03985 [Stenotrophomonas maltophilia]|uniref:hypothetical protein n=1 Tax=Stenotrophomonas maltophilia TaxID=40324 RepID=UPI001F352CD0|nr:hypothetical protein [Stenotrophomonas maltophilia]MCF3528046.1 hypothetical protein [Stenotrophomonas maltophilia]MCF3531930.1 hypothetical protein [Stenotrophomonas maltophilia]